MLVAFSNRGFDSYKGTPNPTDLFLVPGFPACTKGTIIVKGTSKAVTIYDDLGNAVFAGAGSPLSGDVKSTFSTPPDWNASIEATYRILIVTWDDISEPIMKTRVVGVVSATRPPVPPNDA